ncbi:hypothetical protein ACRASX_02215 [Flavobacterium sp. TMP13]|uniref:hypothetical protein n=1 Tax=unclassified Flavobacterium TaxID=196869 RepID=UPI00076DE1AD|nr:hypothetical protein [Flavobacterium sp. TAB 87]KVV14381.1 hypothetical protein AP058_02273 [Flavobacterium sp. TAB 87]
MPTSEIKTLEEFKQFASYHFKVLDAETNGSDGCVHKIKVAGYSDMMGLGLNLIKMCLEIIQMENLDNTDVDIGSVLELALQMFPRAELEVLDEIHLMLISEAPKKI